MSDKDTVAYNLLLKSILETHHSNREKNLSGSFEGDFIDFSDEEITRFVKHLWSERYQEEITNFKKQISTSILENSRNL